MAITPLELHRHLDKSNCGRCHLPSCFAFAAAVVAGSKQLKDCPQLSPALRAKISFSLQTRADLVPEQAAFIDRLQEKICEVDLAGIAGKIGGVYSADRLILDSLGKSFAVDHRGEVYSDCHIIPWVKAPLLSYITHHEHQAITGRWITFRELQGGMEWQNLFTSRCENVLKDLADSNPGLFADIVDLFMGIPTSGFEADIALILHPLPHFPLLICYQAPEQDLASKLTIFFDSCCGVNLHIKSIFTLCSGLVQMFDKIAGLHG
jgi:hypothetical protein